MCKISRWSVTFAILLILLSTLAGSALAAPRQPRAKWTVMVYISGDNNLEEYAVKDIELELAPTGSSAEVQVVALADRGPGYDDSYGDWQTTKLFHVTQGMTAAPENAVADWGERNMGDPQTLIDFVTWTKDNYPADHYALYFWGHGWSWHPGYVMADDTDADSLDIDEVKDALPDIGFIDVVGYDACNMASIEVQSLWHGNASVVVGSQDFINWDGIEYDVVLEQLSADPKMTPDEVAIATSRSVSNDRSMSAVAVDRRFGKLLTAVDEWSLALIAGLPNYRIKYHQALMLTQDFSNAPMDKDLYDMAYQIDRLVSDANIQAKSQAVMRAVEAVVLDEHHTQPIRDAHGITIYHIAKDDPQGEEFAYYRSELDFTQQTGWDEFLAAYESD
jgi:hypothetical protein